MAQTKTVLELTTGDVESAFKRLDKLNRDLDAVSFGELKSEIDAAVRALDSALGGLEDIAANGL